MEMLKWAAAVTFVIVAAVFIVRSMSMTAELVGNRCHDEAKLVTDMSNGIRCDLGARLQINGNIVQCVCPAKPEEK